ncbi:MAG: polymerase subunit beta [Patescibacteria group bacterium]|nr:polymerase subunit beta [Patescibacteria group bacterium]
MLKIEVNRQSLLNILQIESRGANQHADLPILSSVLIQADKTTALLKLTSTNLNQAILSTIKANIISDGVIAVPARITIDFLSSISDELVTLEEGKNLRLKISTKNHQSSIYLLNPEDYPKIPEVSKAESIKLNCSQFKEAISAVAFAASKDDTRPVFCGVMFYTVDSSSLYMVSTDSYRLAEKTIPIVSASQNIEDIIIPSATIQDLLKIIQSQEVESIELIAEVDQVSFIIGDVTLISRLISGEYPAYKNLIPASSDINFTIDRAELLQTVKIAALFARESAGAISLQVEKEDQVLTVNSIANQVGENHSQIAVSTDSSGSINLNSRYLIDALGSFDSDLLDIRFSKGLTPFIISANSDKKSAPVHQHIIMPINT